MGGGGGGGGGGFCQRIPCYVLYKNIKNASTHATTLYLPCTESIFTLCVSSCSSHCLLFVSG